VPTPPALLRATSLASSYKYQSLGHSLSIVPNFIVASMPSRDTIVVRNLPELTTEADIQTFFNTRIKNAETLVFPLVSDSQRAFSKFKCATVELNHAVKDKALKCNGDEFIPAAGGGKSKIEIDASLLGAVTLASHNCPEFEYVCSPVPRTCRCR
jgi:hypothetical protein